METPRSKITHLLRPAGNETVENALHRRANVLQAKLKEKFGGEYEVTSDKFAELEDKWSHEVKVRKGMQIGAGVQFEWEAKRAKMLELEVDQSTKIGFYIMMGTLLPAIVIGGAMGIFGIPPFDFLPGTKIAGLISALIALVPGIVIVMILRSILMGKHKEENKQLQAEVHAVVKENFVDNILQFYDADGSSEVSKG